MALRISLYLATLMAGRVYAAAPECGAEHGRKFETISGAIVIEEVFEALTPSGWIFRLIPTKYGWIIEVSQSGREDEDISRLTTPRHNGNPRVLEGWQFRNRSNTGPNDGSVNEPQEMRHFIFSPEVGRTLHYNGSVTTSEDVEAVQSFGRGWLFLDSYTLTPFAVGERASFEAIVLTTCLTWPE